MNALALLGRIVAATSILLIVSSHVIVFEMKPAMKKTRK